MKSFFYQTNEMGRPWYYAVAIATSDCASYIRASMSEPHTDVFYVSCVCLSVYVRLTVNTLSSE